MPEKDKGNRFVIVTDVVIQMKQIFDGWVADRDIAGHERVCAESREAPGRIPRCLLRPCSPQSSGTRGDKIQSSDSLRISDSVIFMW